MAQAKTVSPVITQNGDIPQIYPIVNEVYKESSGQSDIEVLDLEDMIAIGKELERTGSLDIWLNTLARRIGLTLDDYRPYTSKFAVLDRSAIEWGAIVQKLTVEMPEAKEDKMWEVGALDGQSVDQWIINNPKVHQTFFDSHSPYSFYITIQTKFLREAFLSASGMNSLITAIKGKVQNKKEITIENLARLAVNNFISMMKQTQHFHLVSIYNSLTSSTLTTNSARFNADFQRWATGFINTISEKMTDSTGLYNTDGKVDEFTPKSEQMCIMLADYAMMYKTVVSYSAFNPADVALAHNLTVSHWQAIGKNTKNDFDAISSIKVKNSKGSTVELKNLIGVIFDKEALGTFRRDDEVLTTPLNARAAYYNTFWHVDQFWFNDTARNGVAFFLD